jgi:outer membrane protein OmpA-like peptidoglycan-associated protein
MLGRKKYEDVDWGPIADLMSGLMIVFLFISVLYMRNVTKEKEKIEEVAVTYDKLQTELYVDLSNEFKNDLETWNAMIDRQTLSVRFQSPEILFESGSAELKSAFEKILDDFFPRYIHILSNSKYRENIEEIRIEGHTSSEWQFDADEMQSYFGNMKLSQDRTRAVLEHVLTHTAFPNDLMDWLKHSLTANGLSSSKLILAAGIEDKERSRRVEFRVRTNADLQMIKILNMGE